MRHPLAQACRLLLRLGQGEATLPEIYDLSGSALAWRRAWAPALAPALRHRRGRVSLDRARLPDLARAVPLRGGTRRAVVAAAALLLAARTLPELASLTGAPRWRRGEPSLRDLQAAGLPLEERPGGRWALRPPWRGPAAAALASYLDEGTLEAGDLWRFAEGWPPERAALVAEAIRLRESSRQRPPTGAEAKLLERIRAVFGLQ